MSDIETPRTRLRFSRDLRLRRRSEFNRLLSEGKRSSDPCLRIWTLANGLDVTRLGLIVGKRHGNAVRRNRIKRAIREAFRLCHEQIPAGLDIACAPQVGGSTKQQNLIVSLTRQTARLARRLRLPESQVTDGTSANGGSNA